MEVKFRTRKLARVFGRQELLQREYGQENARIIMRRMSVLLAAPTLKDVPATKPERRHQLEGSRSAQFAVDAKNPYRIVFVPANDPVPMLVNGGYDLSRITAITIVAMEDYH